MKLILIFALFISGKFSRFNFWLSSSRFIKLANAAVIEKEASERQFSDTYGPPQRQLDTVIVPPNDNFEESSREEDDDNEEEVLKARK